MDTRPLVDGFGRIHTYLRVSVTDRCNFRCVYCMPPEGVAWMPRPDILTYEELARLVRIFVGLGIRKVRLTGGEPTIRRDFVQLVAALGRLEGLDDLSVTTNGLRLAGMAHELATAGLRRVNVSLDTLRPDRFRAITRGGDLRRVLVGIDAALEAGLVPVKINAVVLAGVNDDEVEDLVAWAARDTQRLQLRFIEYMPFEARLHRCVPAHRIRQRLAERMDLEPCDRQVGDGPARTWRDRRTGQVIGFISPLSASFCASCNRLRLQADGHLRTCLSDDRTPSLRELLRGGADDAAIAGAIRKMVLGKREGHGCEVEGGRLFEGVMTQVGG